MFVVFALIAAALAANVTWPSAYKFEGEFQVLEANVTLPIIVNYNETANQLNFMYFNSSMEYSIWDNKDVYYYIHVKKDHQECVTIKQANFMPDMYEFLPDLTNYEDLGETKVRGVSVKKYQWVDVEGDVNTNLHRQNIYTMYVDATTGYPVRFDLDGYDIVLGSHFDQYRIEYYTFKPDYNDRGAYAQPTICSSHGISAEQLAANPISDRYGLLINNLMKPRRAFNEYAAKYGKVYANQEEADYRYRVYQNNLKTINSINADTKRTWRAAPNKFADMTMDEIREILLSKRTARNEEPKNITKAVERADELPTHLDWRLKTGVVGRVKDQCACGSCWAFAAVSTMEGRYAVAKNLTDHVYFSEQFTIDCFWDANDNGCNGGNSENVFNWAAKEVNGYTSEWDGQYIGINAYCNESKINPDYKVKDWAMVEQGNSDALKTALLNGPVAVAINVPDSMVWYNDGIYNDQSCTSGWETLDHAVTCEGWAVDEEFGEYWIIKNSWSTWWGKDGYIYIPLKDNLCGVTTDASYPIY